jgi:hypothetical protein
MKTYKYFLSIAASLCVFSSAQAQVLTGSGTQLLPPDTQTQLANEATHSTGTILKKDIRWQSKIPLNKTYGELTPEQKAVLHAMYRDLGEGDEPPFPEKGIKPIFNAVRNAQRIANSRGELDMVVTVGPDGKATKVENFGSSSARLAETAQQILLLTPYKPGLCGGQPCTMQFRFQQKLAGG